MNISVWQIYTQKINEIQSRIPVKLNLNPTRSFSSILSEKVHNNESINTFIKTPTNFDSNYSHIVNEVSKTFGIDSSIINAVIKAESGFKNNVISSAGAMGLMQLMPQTAKYLGVENAFDPTENIFGGTNYLKKMLDQFGGDLKIALAAYNAGPGTINKLNITDLSDSAQFEKLPKETQNYIKKIYGYLGLEF